jgi:hypothetical protein
MILLLVLVILLFVGPGTWGALGGWLARGIPVESLGRIDARDLESARTDAMPSRWTSAVLNGLGVLFLILWIGRMASVSTDTGFRWTSGSSGLSFSEREIAQESDDAMFSEAMSEVDMRDATPGGYHRYSSRVSTGLVGSVLLGGLSAGPLCWIAFLREAGRRRLGEFAATWAPQHWQGIAPIGVPGFEEGSIHVRVYGRLKEGNQLAIREGRVPNLARATTLGRALRAEGLQVEVTYEEKRGKVTWLVHPAASGA